MYGLEKIELTSALPSGSDNLKLGVPPAGVRFDPGNGCWLVEKRSSASFVYDLDVAKDLTLSLGLKFDSTNSGRFPLRITCNTQVVADGLEPGTSTTLEKTWHVPFEFTKGGRNVFIVSVGAQAPSDLLINSVYIGNFVIQPQIQTQWCWIASALSVLDYLERSANPYTQCSMYDKIKQTEDTCHASNEVLEHRNQTGWPSNVLNVAYRLRPDGDVNRAATWHELLGESDGNRPVICIITWKGMGGHAVVISSAYEAAGKKWVVVNDPSHGAIKRLEYDTLLTAYKQPGDTWTGTVFCTSERVSA